MSSNADGAHRVEVDTRHDSADTRRVEERSIEPKPAKTSAAAAFALALGVAALIFALTVVLSPIGLVVGLIGIILGILGMKAAKRPGITGKGVAITGLVFSVIAVLLGLTIAVGVTTFLNNEGAVNRLEKQVTQLRDKLPTDVNIPQP